jgi:hypothetical protein
MRHFCTEFAAQHKVTVDVTFEDVPSEIASGVSLCLFRVLQGRAAQRDETQRRAPVRGPAPEL